MMPQLSASLRGLDPEEIERMLHTEKMVLFSALVDHQIVGLLSVVWYDVPSGRKGWIEDVVVDQTVRGLGVGRALVRHAKSFAEKIGIQKLMLTSSEHRVAARALYRSEGFDEAQTTLFLLKK